MSNRRKPKHPGIPLDGEDELTPPVAADLMSPTEWTDQPPAQYTKQTLQWIAEHRHERGRMNVWACEECQVEVLCFDLHPGVTPFMVSHATLGDPDCRGMCRSHFYSGLSAAVVRDRLGGPSHEWYRPSAGELSRSSRYTRDHVAQGGLLVREVTGYEPPYRGHTQGTIVRRVADPAAPTLGELTDPANVIPLFGARDETRR